MLPPAVIPRLHDRFPDWLGIRVDAQNTQKRQCRKGRSPWLRPCEVSPRKSAEKHAPPAHWPSPPRSASSRAPQPSTATRARPAATSADGASVRSRSTWQRTPGSESSNQSRTVTCGLQARFTGIGTSPRGEKPQKRTGRGVAGRLRPRLGTFLPHHVPSSTADTPTLAADAHTSVSPTEPAQNDSTPAEADTRQPTSEAQAQAGPPAASPRGSKTIRQRWRPVLGKSRRRCWSATATRRISWRLRSEVTRVSDTKREGHPADSGWPSHGGFRSASPSTPDC